MPKKRKIGFVVSNKMQKTVVVKTTRLKMHPLYKKRYKVSKKFKAHTEDRCEIGDKVVIEETRPISKTKHWKVVKIIKEKR